MRQTTAIDVATFRWRTYRKHRLEASDDAGLAVAAVPVPAPSRDTSQTRRAAQTDLFAGIGEATETNLALGGILRDAFLIVDEMTSFSGDFDGTAEMTRTRAEQFVASICTLQSQSDVIEDRLTTASQAIEKAHERSRSALASVEDLTASINEIERVIKVIASIAAHTNLLALNATIEAARAGASGAGFRVVAGEVKALSQQTQKATNEIVASVKRIRDRAQVNMAEVKDFDQAIGSLEGVFAAVHTAIVSQGVQTREIGVGSEAVASLAQTVRTNAKRLQTLGGLVKAMTSGAEQAVDKARQAFTRLTDRAAIVLRHGDGQDETRWPIMLHGVLSKGGASFKIRVIDLSLNALQIETGRDFPAWSLGETLEIDVETLGRFAVRLLSPTFSGFEAVAVDPSAAVSGRIESEVERLAAFYRPYIDRVVATASDLSLALDRALQDGSIADADLFDESYRLEGHFDPPLYRNAAVEPLEPVARMAIEEALIADPKPDFCMLQDRNGFNPIHNRHCSLPRREGDRTWNLRHSRMRRIFDDRVGMAASRNLKPFLIQSYARDMGDKVDIRMEFDAPIFVAGRHWGTLRMAYDLN
jgi:methyl-accepting chemotaxis protein